MPGVDYQGPLTACGKSTLQGSGRIKNASEHLVCTDCVPSIVLRILCVGYNLHCYHHPRSTNEETEVGQVQEVTCPRSLSYYVAGLGCDPRQPGSGAHVHNHVLSQFWMPSNQRA